MVGTEARRSTEGARHCLHICRRSVATSRRADEPQRRDHRTMPHQALYRRWRAQTFAQIVGQEAVVETLRNAVRDSSGSRTRCCSSGRAAPARRRWPGSSPRPSTARTCATAIRATVCPSCVAIREGTTLDVLEIDAASNRGINEVRDLRDRLAYAAEPAATQGLHPRRGAPDHQGRLERAPQVARGAARLRRLHVRVDRSRPGFPPAILSRLQRYDVRRLTVPEIEGKLGPHPRGRGRDRPSPRPSTLIARLAAGGMRDAESMLDQLIVVGRPARTHGRPRPRPARSRRRGGDRRLRRRARSAVTPRPGSASSTPSRSVAATRVLPRPGRRRPAGGDLCSPRGCRGR